MNKYKNGEVLKSNYTGYGLTFGKEYIVEDTKYFISDYVPIRNDYGYVELYSVDYFELVR